MELSRKGYRSEEKRVVTEKGEFVIENLTPDKKEDRMLKAAGSELYRVFSKYHSKSLKQG